MKKIIFFSLGLQLLSSLAWSKGPTLPADWFVSPESQELNASQASGQLDLVEKQIEQLFRIHSEVLSEMKPKGSRGWGVTGATFDLAVSMNGIVGGLFGDGISAASAFWKRRGTPESQDDVSQGFSTITIDDSFTRAELERALDPALRVLQATVSEKKPGLIKKHLLSTAENFLEVAKQLRHTPEGRWRVSQYIMDFGIDAAGKITGIKAGVDVRLRLIWNRKEVTGPHVGQPADGLKNLIRFVREISRDLEGISVDPVERLGYKLSRFSVGIGIDSGGEVVVVKGLARTLGRLSFTPDGKGPLDSKAGLRDVEDEGDASIRVALRGDDPALKIALSGEEDPCKKTGGIFDPPGNPYEEFSCKVNRKKFRDGMVKGVKMATLFAKGAPKNPQSRWDLHRIRTNFELSVSGNWYMPWLKGRSTMDMEFTQIVKREAPAEAFGLASAMPRVQRFDSQTFAEFAGASLRSQRLALAQTGDTQSSGEARSSAEGRAVPDYPDFDAWSFNQFQFRIKGTAGINLHWLLKAEFLPEIETVWQR